MSNADRSATAPRRRAVLKLALVALASGALALTIASQPLTAPLPNTLKMADMTWVEVRSAIAQGYTRVIVPSGGIEQNGAHMILGKHDHIVGFAAERIAGELGHLLAIDGVLEKFVGRVHRRLHRHTPRWDSCSSPRYVHYRTKSNGVPRRRFRLKWCRSQTRALHLLLFGLW